MIPAQDDREDPTRCHGADPLTNCGVRHFDESVGAVRVAEVDDLEGIEDLDSEIEVEGARAVGEGAKRPRAKARSRTIRRRIVPGGTDDGGIGRPAIELFGLSEQRTLRERRDSLVGRTRELRRGIREAVDGRVRSPS